jgi:hypothetical protein
MKKEILVILFLFTSINIFSQFNPSTYLLDEDKKFEKSNSQNPASNSISDIITRGDSVWLGTSRGVSLSTDRGETWTNFYATEAFGTEAISAIGFDKYTGYFWAATAHSTEVAGGQTLPEGSGLRFTSDGGNTWHTVPQPVDAETDTIVQYGINNLRAVPITVRIQNLIYDIAFTPGTVWIASFAGGVRKSSNNGATWERVVLPPDNLNSVSPEDTLNFCLAPVAGRICAEGHLNYRAFSVISVDDSTLYVGTANGINKSTDNGISWRKFNHGNQLNPISGNFVVALDYNHNNNTLWGATWRAEGQMEFYGVSSSTDGGENWNTFLNGERPHNFAFKGNHVIVPTDNGAYRTTNEGITWTSPAAIVDKASGQSLSTTIFYSAAVEQNTIWLGTNDGLVKLQEKPGGMIWEGDWKIYFASPALVSNEDSYAYPNPFSPRIHQLKFKYSTNGISENVTIRIFNFGMNLVKTVIQNAPRTRSLDDAPDRWDGRDEYGEIVPNGVYFYRIDVGSNEPLFGKIIVLQ